MSDQPQTGNASRRRPNKLHNALSFEGLLSLLNSIGTLWIFGLMVVICLDVFGRTAINAPLPGVLELVRLSIVGIVFIQLGHTLRAGRITRSESLILYVQRRWPHIGFGMQALFDLAGTAIFIVLVEASIPLLFRSWSSGEYAGVEGYVTYPVWPVRLLIVLGSACAAVQFLLFAWRDAKAAWIGKAPLTESPEAVETLAYGEN